MKKKLLSLLAVCLLCIGLSATVAASDQAISPPDGVTIDGSAPMSDEAFTHPWAGDIYNANFDDYTFEVLDGEENVELNYHRVWGGNNNNHIRFLKPGTVQIKAILKSNPEEIQTYTFTILPAETPYVEYLIPKKVKVGYAYTLPYIYHNCTYSDYESLGAVFESHFNECLKTDQTNSGEFYITGKRITYAIWTPRCFSKPGTFYVSALRDKDNPYAITVEEPIINTNLPKKIQVGTELQMITSLDNTALENKKITDVKGDFYAICDGGYGYQPAASDFGLGYQPKVEILSGAELVARSNGDYSNILNTTENIKFTGEGTVTFKITYEMLPIDPATTRIVTDEGAIYSPEKTFSVEVISEPVENIEISDHTDKNITADTSGLDLDTIYKNNNLDPSINDIEISLTQQKATEKDSAKLEQRAGKDGYSVKTVYEILMSLYADGNKITDLTDNFGTLKLKLMVGKEYAGKKAVVYQLHNGSEIIVHDKLTVNTDGTVSLNTDKLSTFAVAVADSSTTVTTTSVNNTTNPNGVRTGDSTAPIIWITLCIIAAGISIFLIKRKYMKFTR